MIVQSFRLPFFISVFFFLSFSARNSPSLLLTSITSLFRLFILISIDVEVQSLIEFIEWLVLLKTFIYSPTAEHTLAHTHIQGKRPTYFFHRLVLCIFLNSKLDYYQNDWPNVIQFENI